MAKIALSKDAPQDGVVTIGFGDKSFPVSAKKPYSTDDRTIIEQAQSHALLVVDDSDGHDAKAADEQAKRVQEALDARDEYKRALAEKDPMDPAPDPGFELAGTPATVIVEDAPAPLDTTKADSKQADSKEAKD